MEGRVTNCRNILLSIGWGEAMPRPVSGVSEPVSGVSDSVSCPSDPVEQSGQKSLRHVAMAERSFSIIFITRDLFCDFGSKGLVTLQ